MTIQNLVAFRKDPTEIKDGYQETVLHVGAVTNRLDELKATLEPRFDQRPSFEQEGFGRGNENTEYRLRGAVHGVDYEVSLEHIECPVPYANAEVHHASVRLRKGITDELTPLIEQEFRRYESEVNARNGVAEENLQEATR
jgi:hypothetical protein